MPTISAFSRLCALLLTAMCAAAPAMAQRVIVNPSIEANDPQGPGAANCEIDADQPSRAGEIGTK